MNTDCSIPATKKCTYRPDLEKEQNVVGQRIAAARKAKGLSLAEMQERLRCCGLNIAKSTLSRWESGAIMPNVYQFLAVAQILGKEESLLFFTTQAPVLNEEGLRKLQDYKQDLIDTGNYRPQERLTCQRVRLIPMPISSLPVSAGTGAFLEDDSFESISFPENSVPTGAAFGLRVSGDSMEPVYHDGQIVWIQPCTGLRPGEVGIFIYDGDGYLKVYDEQLPEDPDGFVDSDGRVQMQPVLISYNEAYPPKLVSPHAQFRIVGRVLKA